MTGKREHPDLVEPNGSELAQMTQGHKGMRVEFSEFIHVTQLLLSSQKSSAKTLNDHDNSLPPFGVRPIP